jgi:hypothetical protein
MQPRESITLQQLVSEFDLRMDQVPDISPSEDIETLKSNLEEFKKVIKSQYRKLVKKYHPDVAEDKALAHERLIRLNKLMKCVNMIEIKVQTLMPQSTVQFRYSGGGTAYWYNNSTTASSTGTTW